MTEQSLQSTKASDTDGRDSLSPEIRSPLGAAQAKAAQRVASDRPRQIGESIPRIVAPCLPSETPLVVDRPFGGANVPPKPVEVADDAARRLKRALARTPAHLYAVSDVPKRHRRVLTNGTSPPEWTRVRDRIRDRVGSGFLIALIGNRGTGKTQLAQQAVLMASAAGRTSKYTWTLDFIMELQAAFNTTAVEARLDVVRRHRTPQLLVLDEFQVRGETLFENLMLDHLIDRRYAAMMDTLLIANLLPEKLRESIGESVSDRLRETGGVMKCDWPSFRTQPQENAELAR